MVAIIALNVLFAIVVIGGVVGLLARSIWTSRAEPTAALAQPQRAQARTRAVRRRLATAAG